MNKLKYQNRRNFLKDQRRTVIEKIIVLDKPFETEYYDLIAMFHGFDSEISALDMVLKHIENNN